MEDFNKERTDPWSRPPTEADEIRALKAKLVVQEDKTAILEFKLEQLTYQVEALTHQQAMSGRSPAAGSLDQMLSEEADELARKVVSFTSYRRNQGG